MINILAPAKINLALDVLYRRPDGYHEVDMVMQSLTLADEICLEPGEDIELYCNHGAVPLDSRNLAWRAVRLIQEELALSKGIKITIHKKIPVAAGLAGGSTDAAAVLLGLDQLWKLNLPQSQLRELGVKLGADVPFCIMRQSARAQGIGEKLTPINSALQCRVLLITPNIGVSTPFVYNQLRTDRIGKHPRVAEVIAALQTGDPERLAREWGNVLEEVVMRHFPEVAFIKNLIKSEGIGPCLMSGSGPTVFALNPQEERLPALYRQLPPKWFTCVCEFINCCDLNGMEHGS
jgi:4-diphosphocytidyl-2-C-methyl-D-erythritol kinase